MAVLAHKIVPHLWFDREAREAAEFYCSVFPDSRIVHVGTLHGTPSGTVETVSFQLLGQPFLAISAGPFFRFTEAISFVVLCDAQEEVDRYWGALSASPEAEACGWLKDRYGVSWQIVPRVLLEMLQDPDPQRVARVTATLLGMKKLEIAALRASFEGT